MKKRFSFPLSPLVHIVRCSVLLLAGCVSVTPSALNDVSPTQGLSLETGTNSPPAFHQIEIPEQQDLQTVDLVSEPDDLFARIRQGFSVEELEGKRVSQRQQWYMERPEQLRIMVERSRLYLYHIVEELDKRGMPMELALLPMVESGYNPMAYSRARASGLWQFIPSTGKHYNLGQNWWKDERRDIVASTAAALEYLQLAYEMYGDWHLALASYNCGAGAVTRAIDKNRALGRPTDYPSLNLPDETRYYIPKLQALKNIFRDPALMAELDLPSVPNQPYFSTYKTDSHIDVTLAAEFAEMPVNEFVALNPSHNRPVILPETPLVIPTEKLEIFVSRMEAHGNENKPFSVWQTYTLRPGDSLENIAPRFGMSVAQLKTVNGIQGRFLVSPGLTLLVPGGTSFHGTAALPALPEGRRWPEVGVHVVSRGENLAGIARRYGLSLANIKRINGLKGNQIAIGERLRVELVRTTVRTPSRTGKGLIYVVRQGDTIYSIARQFNIAQGELMRINRVTPQTLRAGAMLTIRSGARS